MTLVTIYLDVDDVINVLPGTGSPQGWGKLEKGKAYPGDTGQMGGWAQAPGYTITWAPAMVDQLREIVADPDVELVWATTWQEWAAPKIGELINLGQDSRHLSQKTKFGYWSIDWKHDEVQDEHALNPEGRFIWIDNELTQHHVDMWPSQLVLPINERTGISVKDVERIREFIATVKAEAAAKAEKEETDKDED